MPKWNEGDTCYLTCVKGFAFKKPTKGVVLIVGDGELLIDVPNAYKTPWTKSMNEVFKTEEEAKEYADLECEMMPSLNDIMSVQPMTAPIGNHYAIKYRYSQTPIPTPVQTHGDVNKDSGSPRQPEEEGDSR